MSWTTMLVPFCPISHCTQKDANDLAGSFRLKAIHRGVVAREPADNGTFTSHTVTKKAPGSRLGPAARLPRLAWVLSKARASGDRSAREEGPNP